MRSSGASTFPESIWKMTSNYPLILAGMKSRQKPAGRGGGGFRGESEAWIVLGVVYVCTYIQCIHIPQSLSRTTLSTTEIFLCVDP